MLHNIWPVMTLTSIIGVADGVALQFDLALFWDFHVRVVWTNRVRLYGCNNAE
jgi:hypothetical protein